MESNLYGIGYIDGQARTSLTNLDLPENTVEGNIIKMWGYGTTHYILTDRNKIYKRTSTSTTNNNLDLFYEMPFNYNIDDVQGYYVLSGSVIYKMSGDSFIEYATNVERLLGADQNFIVYKTGDGVYHMFEGNEEFTNISQPNKEWTGAVLLRAYGGGSSRYRLICIYNENELSYWNSTTNYTAPKKIKKVVKRELSTSSASALILFEDGTLAEGTNFTDVSNIFTDSKYYDIDNNTSYGHYTIAVGENETTFYKNFGSYGSTQVITLPGKYVKNAYIMSLVTTNGTVWETYNSFILVTNLITYEWTIKDQNEETLVTGEVMPALSAYLSVNNEVGTLRVTDVLDRNVDILFNIPQAPKGYGFAGLSTNKNANEAEIIINETTLLYGLAQDLDLYIIYQKILPSDAINVILYQNRGEKNRVNKRNYLTEVMKLRGVFRGPFSIEEPTLTLQLNEFINFNYVYIQELQRYYFVRSSSGLNNNFYDINLKVDPLFSFMNEFRTSTAEILRSSIVSKQDPYIVDNLLPLKNDNIIDVYTIDNDIFNNDNDVWKDNFNYVLSCIRAVNLKAAHDFEDWQAGGG